MGLFDGVEEPVTREKVRALAEELAADPSTVREVVHPGFAEDAASGGFAFAYDSTLLIYAYDGSRGEFSELEHQAEIAKFWAERTRNHRPLRLDEVPAPQRAAITALLVGVESVADLPLEMRAEVDDTAVADYYLVSIRRHARAAIERGAIRVLTSYDNYLAPPDELTRAHPCAACGRPAIGVAWGRRGVCDVCYRFTTCVMHGRDVVGSNTVAIGAGFVAHHRDDHSPCEQATRDGRVFVRELEGRMGEAKFGGVYVAVVPFAEEL